MIAVDTNILVYAHRTEAPKHDLARQWLIYLSEGETPWGLPVFCLGEFLRVVTHRRVFDPPSTLLQATTAIENLLASPSIRLLNPGPRYSARLLEIVRSAEITGNIVFDAQIAAVCQEQGVDTLLTEDRDFGRFGRPKVKLLEPLPK